MNIQILVVHLSRMSLLDLIQEEILDLFLD